MEFVLAFDAWMQKASVSNAGESVARLRLLNELHCNGPRKMAGLADSLGVTPRNVTALVDALEAEGMVGRSAHPSDRRVTMVEITGGSATVERQFDALRTAIADLFSDIDPRQRESFLAVLEDLRARLASRAAAPGR